MKNHTKSHNKRARLLIGALVGTVLSLGAVADSASAGSSSTTTTTTTTQTDGGWGGGATMQSGIRW